MTLVTFIFVVSPAFILLGFAFISVVKFNKSRKGASFKNKLYVTLFFPFLLGKSTTISEESKTHLKRFLKFGALYLVYMLGVFIFAALTVNLTP